jgi:hypothetical protein
MLADASEHYRAVVSTLRARLDHPGVGERRAASPSGDRAATAGLRDLRAGHRDGPARLAVGDRGTAARNWPTPTTHGRGSPTGDRLRLLLREVFTAAGGRHDDWDEYDRVMPEQRPAVVLVEPVRVDGDG